MADRDRAHDVGGRPILFPGTNLCADCGEPYSQPGLIKRCAKRHEKPNPDSWQWLGTGR